MPVDQPSFQLGLGMPSLDYELFRGWARGAESAGFAFVSVGDNPALMRDTYVSLTVLAQTTERCRIGTAVTNPVGRDALVVASAVSSVETLAPGRTFLGLATGRARRPATLAELRAHIVALRELWATGETVHEGDRLRLEWDAPPVPILVCASGPRALRLAGELADGAIVEAGVSDDALRYARHHLAEGARAAGRDPESLEVWWYLKASLADTYDEALDIALAPTAASGGFVLGTDPAGRGAPERFHDACRRLLADYDKTAHLRTDADDPNKRLIDDPHLRSYLLDRFTIVGTPKDWIARVDQLRGRGVDRVFLAAVVPDLGGLIESAGKDVIPALG